jgi:hypothetical protein
MSSSINVQEENPLSGCTVIITDSLGHQFPMADSADGNYYTKIDASYLTQSSSFKVEILTPDGDRIVSDYDHFSPCPDVDTVYYVRKDIPTSEADVFTKGIQFYVDLNGESTDSRYYRWEAIETFEYRADYPIEWFWDGQRIQHTVPPDYTKDTCWSTLLIRDIFTLTTKNLAENKYQQLPLHFVDNTTARLVYGYSLLVKQYSMSETAYKFWTQLKDNSTDQGGLYEQQPLTTKGNLHNLTHPDKDVMGFFGVSSVKEKRIFIQKVENLDLEYQSPCTPAYMDPWGFATYSHLPMPLYLMGDSTGWKPILLDDYCVDCRVLFGKNTKPDFWPN